MCDLLTLKLYLEILASIITVLGVPTAIYLYFLEKKKERKEREYGTYNALDDKYIEFLNLCLNNSDLNVLQYKTEGKIVHTSEQEKRLRMIFEILISIMERAFLMYKDQSSKIKKDQWEGWVLYIQDWMQNNSDFRESWDLISEQWDANFRIYMNSVYTKFKP